MIYLSETQINEVYMYHGHREYKLGISFSLSTTCNLDLSLIGRKTKLFYSNLGRLIIAERNKKNKGQHFLVQDIAMKYDI